MKTVWGGCVIEQPPQIIFRWLRQVCVAIRILSGVLVGIRQEGDRWDLKS